MPEAFDEHETPTDRIKRLSDDDLLKDGLAEVGVHYSAVGLYAEEALRRVLAVEPSLHPELWQRRFEMSELLKNAADEELQSFKDMLAAEREAILREADPFLLDLINKIEADASPTSDLHSPDDLL